MSALSLSLFKITEGLCSRGGAQSVMEKYYLITLQSLAGATTLSNLLTSDVVPRSQSALQSQSLRIFQKH